MSEESPRRKSIRFADKEIPILEPTPIQAVVGDVIVEARDTGTGMYALTFATLNTVGDQGHVEAVVCSRLRISYATFHDLKTSMERNTAKPTKNETH